MVTPDFYYGQSVPMTEDGNEVVYFLYGRTRAGENVNLTAEGERLVASW